MSPNELRFAVQPRGLADLCYPLEGTTESAEQLAEDIGLVNVTFPVHNKFFSVASAKRLIQSTGVYMGDKILVDNCYTGSQILFCHGLRTSKKQQPAPGDTFYVVLEQGIYATNTPFIPRPPQIGLGMCGTPLLRLESSIDPNAQEGDICGFFLCTDLKGYNGSVLFAYSQLTDPLIEEGWSVLVDS